MITEFQYVTLWMRKDWIFAFTTMDLNGLFSPKKKRGRDVEKSQDVALALGHWWSRYEVENGTLKSTFYWSPKLLPCTGHTPVESQIGFSFIHIFSRICHVWSGNSWRKRNARYVLEKPGSKRKFLQETDQNCTRFQRYAAPKHAQGRLQLFTLHFFDFFLLLFLISNSDPEICYQ